MKKRLATSLLFALSLLTPALAKPSTFYRYGDAAGTTHIVTTLNDVPPKFRALAKPMKRNEVSGKGVAKAGKEEPVALQQSSSGLLVSVSFNKKAVGVAILDTGAEVSAISPKLAHTLGYRASHQTMITVATAGASLEVPLVRLKHLDIEEATVTDLSVVVTKIVGPPEVNAIIGLDFLSRFEFEIDSGSPSLTLYELRR